MPAASNDAVFVGVDTHADTHHVAVVDRSDRSRAWEWKALEPTELSWVGF